MDMIDSIECVSSSVGMEDDDAVTSNLPCPFLKTSAVAAAAAAAAAVAAATIGVVPSGGGASDGGITGPLISPAMSMHELLECPVCTNSMYPRSTIIKQRTTLLHRGLSDRSEPVNNECLKMLKDEWLVKYCSGDVISLLRYLDVKTYESVGESMMGVLLKDGAV